MEYSKELHEMLKNQSYDNYPRLRDIYTACLLDEIERLQAENERLQEIINDLVGRDYD